MDPAFRKIHRDINRLHEEEEEKIKSLSAARELGIKVRRIDRTFSTSSSPVNFKPAFFIPPKGDKLSTYHRCAKCASCAAPSSPSSSLSTLPNRLSLSRSFSAWSFSRRFSFSSTRSSPACETEAEPEPKEEEPEGEEQEQLDCEHGERYPYMIRSLAEMQGIEPPALPKAARQPILTANGPVMKGKLPQDEAVELHEDDEWKVTQVLEDTTYNNPHAIVEIVVRGQGYTDGSFLTANEVKAIVRVMKLRMDMRQYRHHGCCPPVLALSYVATRSGNDTEYRSGRILQAYHDGRQLVIQYSERFDLSNAQRAAVSLEKFLRYYFCEPVKTGALAEKKDEDLWKVLQSWSAIKRRYHMDSKKNNENDKNENSENDGADGETKDHFLRHWFNKLLLFA